MIFALCNIDGKKLIDEHTKDALSRNYLVIDFKTNKMLRDSFMACC